MKEKKEAAFRALTEVAKAIESLKHGNTNHVSLTDYLWPQLILSLARDFELTTYMDVYTDLDIDADGEVKPKIQVKMAYTLLDDQEKRSMGSLFSMGRIFLGGVSNEDTIHSPLMRHSDIATIDRFRRFAQRHVENYKFKKSKNGRMRHAQG